MLLELNKFSKRRRLRKLLKPLPMPNLLQKSLLLKRELELPEQRSRRIALSTRPLSKPNMSSSNKESLKSRMLPRLRLMLSLLSKEWSKLRHLPRL